MAARYGHARQVRQGLPRWRTHALLIGFGMLATVLVARAVELQLLDRDFLQHEGNARHLRVMEIPAHRGMIVDRNGEPLAISSPVSTVWADPGDLLQARDRLPELAGLLKLEGEGLVTWLEGRADREFVYLRRHVAPEVARAVTDLGLPGVALQREYRRFYPAGEVTAHVLGFTNIDDHGQEGLELAYNKWLQGEPGAKRIVQDRLGRVIETVERLREPQPGKSLVLSLDRRLQYLAYRELKAAVQQHGARSGSLIVLDAKSGEVLAMVNQPAVNPNNRANLEGQRYRNRAVTDVYEPGSTLKPFTVAAALESGRFEPESRIDTSPGVMPVGRHRVRDRRNFGSIDLATLLRKSSNVGAAKVALALEPDSIWGLLARLGFGRSTGSAFPGEAGGRLAPLPPDGAIERATLAFGYGVSATPLQLAQAYTAIANDGVLRPVSFLKRDRPVDGERVLSADIARSVRRMMEGVVSSEGTAPMAAIPGYRVAGKTGTAEKAVKGSYVDSRNNALFVGMAPASDPRFIGVALIAEPQRGEHYGGQVAAPVFRRVMADALRLWNVPPDTRPSGAEMLVAGGGAR